MDISSCKTNRIEPAVHAVPASVVRALDIIGQLLADCGVVWLVGGSCGALLQGTPLGVVPRDLDVYVDAGEAEAVHAALHAYSVDEQAYSETDQYGSLLSHYEIEGVQVELVGSLQVRLDEAEYEVRIRSVLAPFAAEGTVGAATVRFMPLAHELLFNVLRERRDRYEPLAAGMRSEPARHDPVLRVLLEGNRIGDRFAGRIGELLQAPSEGEESGGER
ncbi:hypothetical protein ACFFNY_28620 [Paenibacillus hodogayensis]|uniref:Nucleotidyltransferase family protein n=1 Tax=Paenibacillus hodogayensis TaxID=279208 RepID=A0ABV5W4T6_9BACL